MAIDLTHLATTVGHHLKFINFEPIYTQCIDGFLKLCYSHIVIV